MVREYVQSDWSEVCRVFDCSKPLELRSAGIEASFVPLVNDDKGIAMFDRSRIIVWADGETLSGFAGHEGDYINWLFVDPALFRRGIARSLLRSVLARIEGKAWLWVAKDNTAAMALYHAEGFEVMEERELKNKGMPCIAMKLARR